MQLTGFAARGGRAGVFVFIVFALNAWLAATPALAQMTRGGVNGTVRDASGAVVPGVTVIVVNVATNQSRDTVTDAEGFYRVSALEPGDYLVRAELAGFQTVETRGVRIVPATEATVNVELKVAGVGEEVTVTAEARAAELNKTSPTIANTVSARAVEQLPLPGGRNLNNLIATAPNVSSTGGQGTYAANGQRSRNNNYMIDGSDNNDISVTISTTPLVPEAVAEFQVITNAYSVEFGRNSGAQVNIITKSGSNRFRGDVWDYYTSSDFYSLTNIEKASGLKEPARFNRHQAGFDLGGPIFREKTFFFGLFQWDGERPGASPGTTVRIPTPAGFATLQNAPLGAGQTAASRAAVLERISFLQNLYSQNLSFRSLQNTLVNGRAIETGLTNVSITSPSTAKSYIARVDHRLTANDNITVRAVHTPREQKELISNCAFGALFCGSQDLKDTNFAASNTHIFTSRLLNEFRFSLVRRDLSFPENDPKSPTATIGGFFTVGGASNFPQGRLTNAYQFSNTMTWTREKHTFKFGADLRYNDVDNQAAFDSKGTFTFNSLQDYMNNFASRFAQALQTASWEAQQWQTFFYLQDDFRVTPDLTVNLGLRYEANGAPLGFFGATDPESLAVGVPGPVEDDRNNWAPRVGFAWSPRGNNRWLGDGKTVVRGGFGMGYDFLFYNLLTVNASNYPRVAVAESFNVQNLYPNLLAGSASPVFNPLNQWVNSAPDTENPESRFWSADIQRELGQVILSAGYTGSRGYKGINQIHMNPGILTEAQAATVIATRNISSIPNVQARRQNPAWGGRLQIPAYTGPGGNDVEARSSYHGAFVRADKRFSHGLQFGGAYTYGRFFSNNDASLGEAGTAQSPQTPQSFFDYDSEWSVSGFDRRHRLVFTYLWEIPAPKRGLLGAIIGGWQIAGITQTQSGAPFTIRTGVDSNGDGSAGGDRPNINPSGSLVWKDDHSSFTNNGYYVTPLGNNNLPLANSMPNGGNAPRNGERGPGFWNTDLSLSKRVTFFGDRAFTVRIDGFNLLNQDNKGTPTNAMNSTSFGENTNNWGRRTFTFSGKFTF
ncbi:MAG: TonB-dependent receptor [Acidobacteria bacterium]|nr:TonB-dependent receptor [Acidobacteriota bacterium]